jgi:signal transduction histidine kinase
MTAMAERIAAGDYAARIRIPDRDEIGALASSLNRMGEALQRLENLRKDLVANVAHELRTPLATLRGYLEAVQDGVVTPAPETITLLHEEVIRLVRLVDALHQLSSFDARAPGRPVEALDAGQIASDAVRRHTGTFASRGVTMGLRVTAKNPASGDADLVAQALNNLLDNALKHTPEGGSVEVAVTDAGPAVRIAVRNTGSAIADDDLPYIFERFFRGEKSRTRDHGGAGIGLAIVKEVAASHHGQVGAESAGGTTTVWFTVTSSSPDPDQILT